MNIRYDDYMIHMGRMPYREYGSLESLKWWIDHKLKIDVSGVSDIDSLWKFLSQSVNLPKEFMIEFSDHLNWRLISQFQNLDEKFMIEFRNKLHLGLIEEYQNVSSRFIESMNLDVSNNWRIKDTYTKIKLLTDLGFKCYKGGFIGETFDPIEYYGFYRDPRYINIEVIFGRKEAIPCRKNKKIYKCLARYEDIFYGKPNSFESGVEVTNAFIFKDDGLFTNSLLKRDYNMINVIFKLSEGPIKLPSQNPLYP